MRICFSFVCGLASAAWVWAASAELQPRRITSVVRADVRTGKLVRSISVTPRAVAEKVIAPVVVGAEISPPKKSEAAAPPTGLDEAVERIAEQQALPPALLHSVIRVESNYNPWAVSPKGAQGLMQLIPSTARRFGVSDVFNPVENIQGGAKYLRYLLNLYNGNYPLALAAYNAGEANVARYGGVPPFAETQSYLVLVRKHLEESRKAAARQKEKEKERPQQVRPAEPNGAPQVNHIAEVVDDAGAVRYVTR